jgi:hypothetical protein
MSREHLSCGIKLIEGVKVAYELGYKQAAKATSPTSVSYSLAGRLYISRNGWGMISVPNALVRGAFDALDEIGAQLPYNEDGVLNAHISVFRPEEVQKIGPASITERGHLFHYSLGRLAEVTPAGWPGVGKAWLIEVKSPELEALRKSYGLTPLMNNNKHQFHITIGIRRRNVLYDNAVKKDASDHNDHAIVEINSCSVTIRGNKDAKWPDRLKRLLERVFEGKGDAGEKR